MGSRTLWARQGAYEFSWNRHLFVCLSADVRLIVSGKVKRYVYI